MSEKTIIIVGGGLNGLGCAKRLRENGVDFKLITENIGGRVKTSTDGETNYGAYYITADCRNLMPYVEKINLVHFAKAHFHGSNGSHYHAYSFRIIKHIPAIIKLLPDLWRFRRHVHKIRKKAKDISYQELIESDPYLKNLYHQKAEVYIKKRGLEKFVREYLEQFLWAAFFTDPREVPTSMFFAVLMTIITPSYSFKMNFDKLTAPFKENIINDSVIAVTKTATNGFELKTKSGTVHNCDILVMATPANITNNLVAPQKIKGAIDVNYYHLRGAIKKEYDVSWYNFFPIEEGAALSREPNGTYLYFYGKKDNISKYFDSWEIIAKDSWFPALFFLGDEYMNKNPSPGLLLANDHDVAGTEDAFINGHYIASLVLRTIHNSK